MSKTGRWVVYEKRGVEYVRVSKRFDTKPEAEKEREWLQQGLSLATFHRKYEASQLVFSHFRFVVRC
jgi:hypothetical protein